MMQTVPSRKNKEFCEKNHIDLFIIFGSHASGKIRPGSDLDVAIKFEHGFEISKLELIYQIGELYVDKEIDLVLLTIDTDPVLLFEIFFNGEAVYEREPGSFENERLRAWKLYNDTEKLRVLQKRYISKKYGEDFKCHLM